MKFLKNSFKVLVSLAFVYFIIQEVDISKIVKYISEITIEYYFFAFVCLNISVVFSAYRVNLYYKVIECNIDKWLNILIYYKGMFYNMIFPGGIGGDGYKIYIYHKFYKVKKLESLKVFLLDRINGLSALLFFLLLCLPFSELSKWFNAFTSLSLILIIFILYYQVNKSYFSGYFKVYFSSVFLSVMVQVFQLISGFLIILSLGIDSNLYMNYLSIFLISSVVAILPITIGGLGSREITFLFFSSFINLNEEKSIAFAFLFYLIILISSLVGVIPIKGKMLSHNHAV